MCTYPVGLETLTRPLYPSFLYFRSFLVRTCGRLLVLVSFLGVVLPSPSATAFYNKCRICTCTSDAPPKLGGKILHVIYKTHLKKLKIRCPIWRELHYNTVTAGAPNICMKMQKIDNLEHTVVYPIQTLKIVLPVYFLAKFDTSLSKLGWCHSICKAYVIGDHV